MNKLCHMLGVALCAVMLFCAMTVNAAPSRSYVMLSEETDTAVIANGAALSGVVDSGGMRLVGILTPAAVTGTQMTLQASPDRGVTFFDVYDAAGNEYVISVGVSRFIPLDPAATAGMRYLRLRSGTAASPVNQAQSTTLTLFFRSM
ncbi:MAG: hypothetical protein WBK91_04145 [Alphaproteobacteria bacterium]